MEENVTLSSAPSTFLPFWEEIRVIVLLFVFSAVILGTIGGNSLVIIAVATTKRLRTVTNCFVVSLAVADLCVAVLVMPIAVVTELRSSWPFGHLACQLWISCDVLLCTSSILNLCCISVDRYMAITRPLMYATRRSKRLALIMIASVWVVSLLITCPPLFGMFGDPGEQQDRCEYIEDLGYVLYSACGSFFVPLLVMVYVYVCIIRVICRREKGFRSPDTPEASFASESDDNCPIGRRKNERASFQREKKAATTLAIVVGGFVICWLPFFTVYVVQPLCSECRVPSSVMSCLTWLGWVNSLLNPFIYAFHNMDFRAAFWRLTLGLVIRPSSAQTTQENPASSTK